MDTRIKGIIFDKDGTLFSYAVVWGPVVKDVADFLLKTVNTKKPKRVVRQELYELIGCDDSGNTYPRGVVFNHQKLLSAFFRVLRFTLRNKIGIKRYAFVQKILKEPALRIEKKLRQMDFTEVKELCDKLVANGIVIGLATNDTTASTRTCLECMQIEEDVDFLRTKESNCFNKPSPQAIRQFCTMYGLEPSEVAVVGDTLLDVQFARKGKAGYVISVLTGGGDREELSKVSDVVYNSVADLINDPVLFPQESNHTPSEF